MNLNSDQEWITKEGSVILIREMELSHILNCLAWLEKRAGSLHSTHILMYYAISWPQGEMACDSFERELSHEESLDPHEWLRGTPAYQALLSAALKKMRAPYVHTSRVHALQTKIYSKAQKYHGSFVDGMNEAANMLHKLLK